MKKLMENWKRYVTLNEATFTSAKRDIEENFLPFFIVSAARSERGEKYSRKNWAAASDVKDFLRDRGVSYTIVDGGYTEKVRDKEGKETGEVTDVQEESYLVIGNKPHYGEESSAIADPQTLFELAKEAASVDKANPQETFSFGYPVDVTDPSTGETRREMRIALYEPFAPAYGDAHMFTEWGGPWKSFQKFMSDEGAYTKIRGRSGTFVEQKLREVMTMKTKCVTDGYRKQSAFKYWTKMKNRWLAEQRRKSERKA